MNIQTGLAQHEASRMTSLPDLRSLFAKSQALIESAQHQTHSITLRNTTNRMKTILTVSVMLTMSLAGCGQQTAQELWDKADKEQKAVRKLELLTEAVELEPRNPMAYCKRGVLHAEYVLQIRDMAASGYSVSNDLKDEHYAAALSDLTKVMELDPKFAEALWWRGNARSYIAKGIEACTDWKAAIALGYKGDIDPTKCP